MSLYRIYEPNDLKAAFNSAGFSDDQARWLMMAAIDAAPSPNELSLWMAIAMKAGPELVSFDAYDDDMADLANKMAPLAWQIFSGPAHQEQVAQ